MYAVYRVRAVPVIGTGANLFHAHIRRIAKTNVCHGPTAAFTVEIYPRLVRVVCKYCRALEPDSS